MSNPVTRFLTGLLALGLFAVSPAGAVDGDYKGSLGKGGHQRYVPPLSNPFLNETPLITTELRPIYLFNQIPDHVPLTGTTDGEIDLWAVQLRVALTDRLGFIFNKNGWEDVNFNTSGMSGDGFTNLGFGFKYAIVSDTRKHSIITAGLTYEAPTGNIKAGNLELQGEGDGYITPFFTAVETANKVSIQAMFGTKIALDDKVNNSWFNYAIHMDYEMLPGFFPLVEFNGFIPISDGERTNATFEGLDLFSVGASDPASTITFAAGGRLKVMNHVLAGVAYEVPLTDDEDILRWRLTADLVIYY